MCSPSSALVRRCSAAVSRSLRSTASTPRPDVHVGCAAQRRGVAAVWRSADSNVRVRVVQPTLGDLDVGERERATHDIGDVVAEFEAGDRLRCSGPRASSSSPRVQCARPSSAAAAPRWRWSSVADRARRTRSAWLDRPVGVAGKERESGPMHCSHGRQTAVRRPGRTRSGGSVADRATSRRSRAAGRGRRCRRSPFGRRRAPWRAPVDRRRGRRGGLRARSAAATPGGPAAWLAAFSSISFAARLVVVDQRARGRWLRWARRCRRTSRSPDGAALERGRAARRGASPARHPRTGGGTGTRCGDRRGESRTGSIAPAPRGLPWRRAGRSPRHTAGP